MAARRPSDRPFTWPRMVFNSAEGFWGAGDQVLHRVQHPSGSAEMRGFAPWVMLCAFAIELYIKALYSLEQGRRPPKKHELDELFQLLSVISRDRIEIAYDEMVSRSLTKRGLQEYVMRTEGYVPQFEMIEEIRNSRLAFVQARYPFDSTLGGLRGTPSAELRDAIRNRILELEPGWGVPRR